MKGSKDSSREPDYGQLLGERLLAAERAGKESLGTEGPGLTPEKKACLIKAAEERKQQISQRKARTRKKLVICAAACAAVVFVFTGAMAGLFDFEFDLKATANPDDEQKVVQAGNDIIIGDATEGVEYSGGFVAEYEKTENIPKDIFEKAHFLKSIVNECRGVKVQVGTSIWNVDTYYQVYGKDVVITEQIIIDKNIKTTLLLQKTNFWKKKNGADIYINYHSESVDYYFVLEESIIAIKATNSFDEKEVEAIIDDLIN